MEINKSLILLFSILLMISCQDITNTKASEDEIWRLGWRMIENSLNENVELADSQFDSLRNISNGIGIKFLKTGLETKSKLEKKEEIIAILNQQSEEVRKQICSEQFLSNLEPCDNLSIEEVENKLLQIELISMYVDDQAARGNLMKDIISKYGLDTTGIAHEYEGGVDRRNRNRLKEIINEVGFPNKKMVGKDAMDGIFFIIQHSDGDKEWQKSQLPKIESAVKNGDMESQDYAYLYDRIRINSGEKQLYGTQFLNVDPILKTFELADTEDIDNLDKRRMEIGMMPIEMYKRFMLKYLSQ